MHVVSFSAHTIHIHTHTSSCSGSYCKFAELTQKNGKEVKKLCKENPEGPFLALTRRRDSVLQKALYSRQVNLVLELLADAKDGGREDFVKRLGHVNLRKNTILHVAATHDTCMPAAVMIFEFAPQLLTSENDVRETPIFLAARYGQLNMFKFLNRKIVNIVPDEENRLNFYKISLGSDQPRSYTILHVAIYNEHFELALYIANTIPSLISEKNHLGMSGLHILAMNSSAFRNRDWKWLRRLLPSPALRLCDTKDDQDVKAAVGPSFSMTIPWWERTKKEYLRYEAALQLAKLLIKKDTDWIDLVSSPDRLSISAPSNEADTDTPDYTGSTAAANQNNANTEADDNTGSAPAANNEADTETPDYTSSTLAANQNNAGAETGDNTGSIPAATEHNSADTNTVSRAAAAADPAGTRKKTVEPPTPLILATKYGCLEIAREIIQQYPQTVEQVGPEYGSILHLAIKYRRIEIFDLVEKMEMQMRRLVRLQDKDHNSILHMVALNITKVKDLKNNSIDATSTDKPAAKGLLPWDAEDLDNETRSPGFELQDDLLLFERIEEILKTQYHKTFNKDYQTADQLFAANKERLKDAAQEWMKRTAENCSIVAVLIATVAFAAAYTVPCGSNPDGSPVLLNEPFFVVFTISDVLSLASTLTAVVVFLSILSSSFRFEDFKESLPKSLMFGISCLIFSLTMMMLAFAATVILMIKNRQQWTRVALYAVAFLPVTVLVATYLPFYVPLMRTFHYTVNKLKSMLPRIHVRCVDISKFKHTTRPRTSSDHSSRV